MRISRSYYDILEIETDANEKEIQDAYRIKIRTMHPDVNKHPDAEKNFMNLHSAYETLMDPEERSKYDASIGVIDKKSVFREFSDSSDDIRRDKKLGLDEESSDDEGTTPISDITSKVSSLLNYFTPKPKTSKLVKNEQITFSKHKKLSKDLLFGDRKYFFTINSLEAILGTERPLIFKDETNSDKRIKVKIPKGTKDKTILQVPVQTAVDSKPKIEIKVIEHEYLKQEDLNLTLHVPFHESEIRNDETILLYTIESEVKIKLPKESFKALRIKDHGLHDTRSGRKGDFFILPLLTTKDLKDLEEVFGETSFSDLRKRIFNLLKPLHDI